MNYNNLNKTVVHRIAYFSRKLNQYSKQRYDYLLRRTDKEPSSTRFERLMKYKDIMHHTLDRI